METDKTLLDAARRMNREALAKIFDLYSSALFRYAFHICNDAMLADNIVGDVFEKLLELLSVGNGPTTNLRSYLFEAAYHRILDETRYSRHRVPLDTVDTLSIDGSSFLRRIENRMLFEPVARALKYELTDYQRHVIVLRFFEGFSLRETAEILGKSVNVVKAAQHHAILILRKTINRQEEEKIAFSARLANSLYS